MLETLYIKDFIIIDRAEIEFDSSLNVITGETGAGKSILLDAILLCLGNKAETGQIRAGQKSASISAEFSIGKNKAAQAWLEQHELINDEEPNICIVRRLLKQNSSSKSYINDNPVTINQLKELAEMLMFIHSQHQHQQLTKRDYQRTLLDNFSGHHDLLNQVKNAFNAWQSAHQKWQELTNKQGELAQQKSFLDFQLKELEQLNPIEGEFDDIEAQYQSLSHSEEILSNCQLAISSLSDDDAGVEHALTQVQRNLEKALKYAPQLQSSADLIENAFINIQEARHDIEHIASNMELDPKELELLETRINIYNTLAKKHGIEAQQLPAHFQALKFQFEDLDDPELSPEVLEKKVNTLWHSYQSLAQQLSQSRQIAAKTFSQFTEKHIQSLGMAQGKFEANISESENPSALGMDHIEFLVSLNPGQPLRSLGKTASGGELSRISLAIQVVGAEKTHIPCICFDEVDVGIGGGIAEVVGELLQNLSDNTQIMCITHLAQVAAHGDIHLHVQKSQDSEQTQTEIHQLSKEQRIQELARMSGGLNLTEQTLAHAKEMLAQFHEQKRKQA